MDVFDKPDVYTCAKCLTQLDFTLSDDFTQLNYFHPVHGATSSEKCPQKDMTFTEPVKILVK